MTEDLTLDPKAFEDRVAGFNDGTVATALLRTQAIIPGFVRVEGYDGLIRQLRQKLRASGGEIIEFPYDWRQSNRVSAHRLQQHLDPIMKARRETHPKAGAVLVGHSMGGLVARYYAAVLDKNRYTKRVVTVGTPYQGAVKALEVLANGRMKLGPFTVKLDELLRSLPSTAELLPAYGCIGPHPPNEDGTVPDLVPLSADSTYGGLPQELLEHGLAFHAELQAAADAQADRNLYRATLGYLQPTPVWASVDNGEVEAHEPARMADRGDGTVPTWSAWPPEWQDPTLGSAPSVGRHASLQQAPEIIRQLAFMITSGERRGAMAADDELSTSAASHVAKGETFTVDAWSREGSDRLALELRLYPEATEPMPDRPPTDEPEPIEIRPLRAVTGEQGRYRASIQATTEGLLRWEVGSVELATNRVDSISDLVLCTDES
ncbi:MAG: alpha/beta fold hydrolase [Acidimicrobiales bacterium]